MALVELGSLRLQAGLSFLEPIFFGLGVYSTKLCWRGGSVHACCWSKPDLEGIGPDVEGDMELGANMGAGIDVGGRVCSADVDKDVGLRADKAVDSNVGMGM